MAIYTLKLRRSGEPDRYGEYDELVLKDIHGEEIPRREDVIDSKEIMNYLQKYDRLNSQNAYYFVNYGNSKFVVTNTEHFLTDNNKSLEAKTIVTAVRTGKSL
jgi:hypothetical protein